MMKYALALSIALVMAAPAAAQAAEKAQAKIINEAGKQAGSATFTQGPHGLLMQVDINDLPAGKHGFHIHSVGTCEPHEHFTTAAGHVKTADDLQHGFMNEDGYEDGDLPNIIIGEDGKTALELFLPGLSLNNLTDDDGASLMIHENPDDHMTQPIGGAGARIACGVIKPQK